MAEVSNAILFFSKHDKSSIELKNILESLNSGIKPVCVDNSRIKKMLMNDEKYGIDRVPCVLIMYSDRTHKVYMNKDLQTWVFELVRISQSQAQIQPEYTPIDTGVIETPVTENYAMKAVRRRPSSEHVKPPVKLNGPGRAKPESDDEYEEGYGPGPDAIPPENNMGYSTGFVQSDYSGLGDLNDAQASMMTEHIKPMDNPKPSAAIKQGTMSAADLAKQMATQRERIDEKLEKSRPPF